MTLKEKFDEVFIENWLVDYAEECEKVTNDFALGFAEWIVKNCNHSKLKTLDYKELLEIYKQGL
jgi:hypothetical protein